jgi:hypothetical protein
VSALPLASRAAFLIEHETEVALVGKLQITSTKLQISLKIQYQMTETHFHFPSRQIEFDLDSMKYSDQFIWIFEFESL